MGNHFDTNPQRYWPDLADNHNCILGKTYDDWMMEEGFSDFYLFDDGSDCCKMWYVYLIMHYIDAMYHFAHCSSISRFLQGFLPIRTAQITMLTPRYQSPKVRVFQRLVVEWCIDTHCIELTPILNLHIFIRQSKRELFLP